MIHDQVQLFISAMANKGVLLLTGGTGITNFFAVTLLTHDKLFALVLSLAMTLATAYFTTRPKMVAALAAREASRHALKEEAQTNLIHRLTEIYEEKVKLFEQQIDHLTTENRLIRISKHNTLGALQAAYWYLDEIRATCAGKVELPPFRKIPVGDIFGQEDTQLMIMEKQKAEERAAKINGNGKQDSQH